ncbi:MAG: glycosyltransferase [Candidatus Paceibacterota bacterium]
MNISILTAVYNEQHIIDTITSWINYLESSDFIDKFEIVICDDHSDVEYFENLKKSLTGNRKVVLLRNQKNEGPGYSFSRCIQSARFDYSLITDSDGQFPIENLDKILELYKQYGNNKLIVFTHRDKKYDNFINIFGQRISNFLCNFIYKTSLNDFTSAFKFVPTLLLKKVSFDARYMNYSLDHTAKLIETKQEFIDESITCEEKEPRKRGLFKEIVRARDRCLYIHHLWYRCFLLKRKVLFHHHDE